MKTAKIKLKLKTTNGTLDFSKEIEVSGEDEGLLILEYLSKEFERQIEKVKTVIKLGYYEINEGGKIKRKKFSKYEIINEGLEVI
jgi:hypothetical protein